MSVTRPVRADRWKDSLFLERYVAVFVLDNQGKALMPCTEKRARLLLARGRARVHRLVPMVIRLIDRQVDSCALQPLRLNLTPAAKPPVSLGARCPSHR
jgi:hypothetical protein